MNVQMYSDNGGRRTLIDRRNLVPSGPVLEKRLDKNRRDGLDRRKNIDPIVRIVGNERREALRNIS
jgi:hypothetical protein